MKETKVSLGNWDNGGLTGRYEKIWEGKRTSVTVKMPLLR